MAGEAQSLCTGACVDPEAHEGCVVSGLAMRTHVHMQRVERRSGPCGSTPSDSRCVWPIRNNSCSASSSRTQAALRNSSRILSVAKSWRFAVGRRAAARSSDLYRLIAGCAPPSPPIRTLGVTLMAGFVLGGESTPPNRESAKRRLRKGWLGQTEALSSATAAQVSEAPASQATQSGALDVGHIWSSD